MQIKFDEVNWLAVGVGLIVAQAYLTVWFVALFSKPWAAAYGAKDAKEHTRALPGYTYAVGAACALLVNLGLALLHSALKIETIGAALMLGLFIAVHFCLATALPGYAFLKRWRAGVLAIGSQTTLIVLLSVLHTML